jgi:hypothetical protein
MYRLLPVTGKISRQRADDTTEVLYELTDQDAKQRLTTLHGLIQILTLADIANINGKSLEAAASEKKTATKIRDGLTK